MAEEPFFVLVRINFSESLGEVHERLNSMNIKSCTPNDVENEIIIGGINNLTLFLTLTQCSICQSQFYRSADTCYY